MKSIEEQIEALIQGSNNLLNAKDYFNNEIDVYNKYDNEELAVSDLVKHHRSLRRFSSHCVTSLNKIPNWKRRIIMKLFKVDLYQFNIGSYKGDV